MPDFSVERQYSNFVVGVDEAGCGPWAGSVVAGAVIFKNYDNIDNELLDILRDSKKLSKKKREYIYNILYDLNGTKLYLSWGQASVEEIDEFNIRNATMFAMTRAVNGLAYAPQFAIIDGNINPQLGIPAKSIIRGDDLSYSIAAASIIAKVTRDKIMQNIAKQHPEYDWENNMGYGTKKHIFAISRYGITKYHRRSFRPIREAISNVCN